MQPDAVPSSDSTVTTAESLSSSSGSSTPMISQAAPNSLPTNMAALQKQQPELYGLLMESSFVEFMHKQTASQERIHKMNQESQQQQRGG